MCVIGGVGLFIGIFCQEQIVLRDYWDLTLDISLACLDYWSLESDVGLACWDSRDLESELEVYQTLPDYTGLYRTMPDYTGLYRTIPDYTGLYRTIPDYTGLSSQSVPIVQPKFSNSLAQIPQ